MITSNLFTHSKVIVQLIEIMCAKTILFCKVQHEMKMYQNVQMFLTSQCHAYKYSFTNDQFEDRQPKFGGL